MSKFAKALREHGADKYHGHRYDRHYDFVIQNEPLSSVLEVGVRKGNSLRAWKDLWPSAIVEGVEIDERYKPFINDEFKIYYADSTKPIDQLKDKSYDMIIDDGDHRWQSQLQTFLQLYDKANKFYVIEDVLGETALNKLLKEISKHCSDVYEIYNSKGIRRNVVVDGVYEKRPQYRMIFFDKTG